MAVGLLLTALLLGHAPSSSLAGTQQTYSSLFASHLMAGLRPPADWRSTMPGTVGKWLNSTQLLQEPGSGGGGGGGGGFTPADYTCLHKLTGDPEDPKSPGLCPDLAGKNLLCELECAPKVEIGGLDAQLTRPSSSPAPTSTFGLAES